MAQPTEKPVIHHMNNSQSQRVLWLNAELNNPCTIVLHTRVKSRSPESLKAVSPTGKAPALVLPSGRAVFETSAIITYLISTYDTTGKFGARPTYYPGEVVGGMGTAGGDGGSMNKNDWLRDEQLTSFAASSLGNTVTLRLMFDLLVTMTPWVMRALPALIQMAMLKGFVGPELKAQLGLLEKELGEEQDWFMGKENPGRADFMLSWPIDLLVARKYVDLKTEGYPMLAAWHERVKGREAWKEGLKQGNGYDLAGSF